MSLEGHIALTALDFDIEATEVARCDKAQRTYAQASGSTGKVTLGIPCILGL